MATPFSSVCAAYATIEDDILSPEIVTPSSVVYVNPAYASARHKNGTDGVHIYLDKLINVDVHRRGCTLIALLPNLSHTAWHEKFVAQAHEVHYIKGTLVFPNPFTDVGQRPENCYLWEVRSYILCIWRPGPSPERQHTAYLRLVDVPKDCINLRKCIKCNKVRVLPRWVDLSIAEMQVGNFECADNPDIKYNSCGIPEFLVHPI